MTDTKQEGPVTHAQLRRRAITDAIIYTDRPKRWRLNESSGWGKQPSRYYLEQAAQSRFARNVIMIEVSKADWDKIETGWKQNQYRRYVGTKSLQAIYEIITGENLRKAIAAQRAEEANAAELMKQHQYRRDVAQTLRAAVDEQMRMEGLVIPGHGVLAKTFLIGAMRDTLNIITHADAKVAEHVAYYSATGWPRRDGPREDD